MSSPEPFIIRAAHRAAELSEGDRRYWSKALLSLGSPRRQQDFLHAPALGPRRRPGSSPGAIYGHISDYHELAFAVEGRARITTLTETFTLAPGMLLIVERGAYHAEMPVEPGEQYSLFWCHCGRTVASFHQGRYRRGRVEVAGVELPGHTDVESIVSAASAELATGEWNHVQAVRHLLAYLATVLVRRLRRGGLQPYRDSHAAVGSSRVCQHVDRALAFCRRNFRDDIKVSNVAEAVGLSSRQLGRVVASHLGVSLSQYLTDLRMAAAKDLLAQRDLSIRDIARAVGYAYPEHFTRAFTRSVGLSPTVYQRNLAGG